MSAIWKIGRSWAALALLAAAPVAAQGTGGAITDLAHEISQADRQRIGRLIADHDSSTGHHILVMTVPTGNAVGLGDIASGTLNTLGPDADRGIVLVHDRASGDTRILAGTLLGGRLSADALYQIQTAIMTPRLQQGDPGGAFADAIAKIIDLDVAAPPPPAGTTEPKPPESSDTLRLALIGAPVLILLYAIFALWVRIGQRRAGIGVIAPSDEQDERVSRRAKTAARLRQAKHGNDHGHMHKSAAAGPAAAKPKTAPPDHHPHPYRAPPPKPPAARPPTPRPAVPAPSARHPTVTRPPMPGGSAPLPGFGRRPDR